MAYGLQFTNNSNVVTLDSEYARLSVIATGRFSPNADSGLGSLTTFPVAATSQEPPLVFVRPDTVGGIAGLCMMRLVGGPGNWTGFYVRAYNAITAPPNGRYFVAAFLAQPVAQYGLAMWDGAGKLLFNSGTPAALFTRAFQNWTYVTTDNDPQGLYRNYYSVSFDFPENEFLLINSFGMRMVTGGTRGRQLYCWWDFPNRKLYAITVALDNPYAFWLPALFAKMAV
ncbi:hypothetical protein [Pseudomonas sp. H1h]|uniref:hypothetical protein n=1 Tax=Pseudomonas sp. H1h TaxID=1397280 RepID=UPI000469D777|nr:hypothetical protein [Pseudomonas sp. H1h]